jgi:hypothetical protein
MLVDFDNPSTIRTVLTSEGRAGYRVEVYRGPDVLIASHPKLIKSFARAFTLGESMQNDARKAYAI